jgi:hypothetical protein
LNRSRSSFSQQENPDERERDRGTSRQLTRT